jgi:hypothetical protein
MSVRAKFKVQRYETSLTMSRKQGGAANEWEEVEVRTIIMQAVVNGSEENKEFFHATPSGEIRLSTISRAAWEAFELGREYYIDFTPASES